ncbi:MAG: type VI secretion system protein TssA [Alphaproteobacteria bacterium]|nr:type VI secretion system protein TssA [Alphaproteobacteria bacterium]
MASDPVLDFDTLLAPIDGDQPSGPDPRPSEPFRDLRLLRSEAGAAEKAAEVDSEAVAPTQSWRAILKKGGALLANSKDVDVACWMVEALVRVHGVVGLRDGFRLLRELLERHGDSIHPRPEPQEGETAGATVLGIGNLLGSSGNGTLVPAIGRLPLTPSRAGGPWALWQWKIALKHEAAAGDAQRSPNRSGIMESVRTSPAESATFFLALRDDLGACRDEFNRLAALLDERYGAEAPATSGIALLLEEVSDAIRLLSAEVLPPETADVAAGEEDPAAPMPVVGGPATFRGGGDHLANRQEAIRVLLDVAAFFKRTEPQSLIGYSLEELARRAQMPLPELLAELLSDDGPRRQLLTAAGIKADF